MESGFGAGRYRGDVVANLGAGLASFLPPAEEAICAENSFLRTMKPFRFGTCSQARVCSRVALHHKRQVPLVTAILSIGAAGSL
jgi:hypothetical protein